MLYTLKEHEGKSLISKEFQESRIIEAKIDKENINVLQESAKGKEKRKLIVKMEAIHVGKTKNSTFYTEEGLKGGLKSWTQPYNKPVLTHHNSYDGEPIGRILNAEFSEQTLSGKSGLIFTVEITDPTAIEKVLDGRYETVSIGATTDKVTCNICGTDRTQEWCEHYPGRKYDEQSCHLIIGNTFGREVSYVNTPSDENAGNRSVQIVDGTEDDETQESASMEVFQMAEGLYQDANNPGINLYEHLNDDVKEMVDLMTKVKEGSENKMTEEEKAALALEEATKQKEKDDLEAAKQAAKKKEEDDLAEAAKQKELDEKDPTKVNEKETDVDILNEKIGLLQASVSDLVLEKQKIESSLAIAESENEKLIAENAKLIEDKHVALAEKVVELKHQLRKADVIGVDKEEAVKDHIKRTSESLDDTLKDLVAESNIVEKPAPGSVKNPGLGEEEEKEKENKKMSINEGVNLMMNMFGKK